MYALDQWVSAWDHSESPGDSWPGLETFSIVQSVEVWMLPPLLFTRSLGSDSCVAPWTTARQASLSFGVGVGRDSACPEPKAFFSATFAEPQTGKEGS